MALFDLVPKLEIGQERNVDVLMMVHVFWLVNLKIIPCNANTSKSFLDFFIRPKSGSNVFLFYFRPLGAQVCY